MSENFQTPWCHFIFLLRESPDKISLTGVVKTLSGTWQADQQKQGKAFFPALTTLNGMPSVLYVDDEPELLTLCRLFLEMDGKNTVETARSAAEGIKKLRAGHFDVIISDYLMPESDGVDFLKQVRAEFGDIPFIIFTGKGREEVVIEAINLGVTFYLQKGSDPASRFSELGRKIEIAVRRTRTECVPGEKQGNLTSSSPWLSISSASLIPMAISGD